MTELTDRVPTTAGVERDASAGSFPAQKRTARITGAWYLLLAITGMLGFLIIRPQIYVDGDAAATLANLVDQETLARLGVVLEVAVVGAQALAAIWFFKLFRTLNHTAAWALAAFGMANALVIAISAVSMVTALAIAGDGTLASAGTVQLLYELSANCWAVGGLFFGLWLIPMGYVVITNQVMPRWLGRILIGGGLGYVLSTFIQFGLADAPTWLIEGLVIPATIGELWMIAYLLVFGIRPHRSADLGFDDRAAEVAYSR